MNSQGESTTAQLRKWHTIKAKQQRLVLLRHASKCTHDDGAVCPVSPHCAMMKRLLKHMQNCRGRSRCPHHYCRGSKKVMGHFRHCKDQACIVCHPVREMIEDERTPQKVVIHHHFHINQETAVHNVCGCCDTGTATTATGHGRRTSIEP